MRPLTTGAILKNTVEGSTLLVNHTTTRCPIRDFWDDICRNGLNRSANRRIAQLLRIVWHPDIVHIRVSHYRYVGESSFAF